MAETHVSLLPQVIAQLKKATKLDREQVTDLQSADFLEGLQLGNPQEIILIYGSWGFVIKLRGPLN